MLTRRPTEEFIKKYEQLAKGRVGAIITGYVGVMPNGKSPALNMAMIDSNDKIVDFDGFGLIFNYIEGFAVRRLAVYLDKPGHNGV